MATGQELEALCKSPQAMARTSSLGLLAGSGMDASGVGEDPRNGHGSTVSVLNGSGPVSSGFSAESSCAGWISWPSWLSVAGVSAWITQVHGL